MDAVRFTKHLWANFQEMANFGIIDGTAAVGAVNEKELFGCADSLLASTGETVQPAWCTSELTTKLTNFTDKLAENGDSLSSKLNFFPDWYFCHNCTEGAEACEADVHYPGCNPGLDGADHGRTMKIEANGTKHCPISKFKQDWLGEDDTKPGCIPPPQPSQSSSGRRLLARAFGM